MDPKTDPPNTTRTVTCTGAVVVTYTGRPVEIVTMVPANEVHKYPKCQSYSNTSSNDSNEKMSQKKE